MIIVTGGAGFIGSALVWGINERGIDEVVIVDDVGHKEQEHNLASVGYSELIGIGEFRKQLLAGDWDGREVTAILHMGACSSTTEQNWEYLQDNNIEYSRDIIRWCVDRGIRCVYASSAATYGKGESGYIDDHDLFDELKPLNLYGKSKLEVDVWARDVGYLEQVAGLRYFNVFGPNEWHKEAMRSVVAKKYEQIKADGLIELFKSNDREYPDGGQMRDFVYVKDVVQVTLFFMDKVEVNGVFNVGTGEARHWNDMARAMFKAVGRDENIQYVNMPEQLSKQYQNYTQADISKLKAAGYKDDFISLEEAVNDYIVNFLETHRHLGEG